MRKTDPNEAMWASEVLVACLQEAGEDTLAGFAAAEYILNAPTPEPTLEPTINASFAYDIHNEKAQGVLNRAVRAGKKLTGDAKKELIAALKTTAPNAGGALLKFIEKYRLKLANLIGTTQLASVLEGAREAATNIPVLAALPGAAPIPPTLEPKEAVSLMNRLEKLTGQERAEAIYELPSNQQTYVHQALAAKEASPPVVPPRFTPLGLPANAPEAIHFPVIDEAVKQLVEKNVITRERFDAIDAASRAKAFTVANMSAEETLTKIRDSIAENIREGVDYETWRKKVLDDVEQGTFLSEGHQEAVFRTVVQTQFSDGQETVLSHPLVRSGFPYRARDAIHDGRVRDTHLALEKLGIQGTNIYRADDPVWRTFRVPWDYNDRCSDTAMTVRQAAEAGIEEAKKWLDTGVEPYPPAHVPMPDFQPPPGFQRMVASTPMSIQMSLQSIAAFSHDLWDEQYHARPPNQTESRPFPVDGDAYPRDNANRFVDKYKIAAAARDPVLLEELLASVPEGQRYKVECAVQHLQTGGTLHHPKEPPGLAINADGVVVDDRWARYAEQAAQRAAWETRQADRDGRRKTADEAVRAIRAKTRDLDAADLFLKGAGATEAEMRAVARVQYLVDTDKWEPEALEEIYEATAEAVHRRIDTSYEMDYEVPAPEEPVTSGMKFSVEEGEQSPDPTNPEINERLDLISGILVLLFGSDSVKVARQLKTEAVNHRKASSRMGSVALAMDVNGIWHGPAPPSQSGWSQITPGPRGGMRWAPTNSPYSAPGAVIPSSSNLPPATYAQQSAGSGAPAQPGKYVQSHRNRLASATVAYNDAMATLSQFNGILSPAQKNTLSKGLSVMSKQQLKSLYDALGGTAVIVGAQRQPWVHAIKAILSGQAPPPDMPPPAARGPKPTTVSQKPSTVPMQAETHWETGRAEPGSLNGVDFEPAPPKFWEKVKDADVDEPPPVSGKKVDRVGVMIQEPDGRIWVVQPTNEYGRRKYTLPGGTVEPGLSNQQNALKEVWEETGLQVEITGYVGDFEDSNTSRNGRLYMGHRAGGAPWTAKVESHIINRKTGKPDAESEKVSLVTLERAAQLLHRTDDLAQLAMVQPISLDTKPSRNVIKKIVDAIQPRAKAYMKRKKVAGEATGDATLYVVQEVRGFNGKPAVVSKADFNTLMARGEHIEMLRGIAQVPPSSLHGASNLTPSQMAEQFRTGDHFPGNGMFGVGTYADSTKGYNNAAIGQYSYGGEVIRMAIPKTAKIVKFTELKSMVQSYPANYEVPPGKKKVDYWRGVQAALAGYDAIHVDGPGYGQGYYVILNRSVVVVQDTKPNRGYTIQ